LQKLIPWEELGFEIVGTAGNGQEALEFVKKQKVDIVITDVTMPILSGIGFLKKAQKESIFFRFIVLSGYQEFEYVKESIQMGAENYLIKPINKEELIETLKKCIKEFEEEKRRMQGEKFLFEHLLKRWVHDDIDYMDLKKMLTTFDLYAETNSYQVLIFPYERELHDPVYQLLHKCKDLYFFHHYDEGQWVIIYFGERVGLECLLKTVQGIYGHKKVAFGKGEEVEKMADVSISYEHAKSSLYLCSFYDHKQHLAVSTTINDLNENIPNLSFLAFKKALGIRNIETIQKEINQIFARLMEYAASPAYTRYIIFLVFMDIYRELEIQDELIYEEMVEKINKASSFKELQMIIKDLMDNLKYKKFKREYSINVQNVLKIIQEEYQEDLTLKAIAERLHLNVMYVGQIFKKETNKSFSQYLNHYRIKLAQNLLLHSELNINEISEKIGYMSPGYFYKNFKKYCGISPKEFRESYQQLFQPIDE
jgi:two-component system, response regulator YesN